MVGKCDRGRPEGTTELRNPYKYLVPKGDRSLLRYLRNTEQPPRFQGVGSWTVEHSKGPQGSWGPDGSSSTADKAVPGVFVVWWMRLHFNAVFFTTYGTDQLRQWRVVICLSVFIVLGAISASIFHLISPPSLFFLNGETGERREDLCPKGAEGDVGERRPNIRRAGHAGLWRAGASII